MSIVESLTGVQESVLTALSEYRWLTTKQMMRLGVTKDKSHLDKVLITLQGPRVKDTGGYKPKEIHGLDYGVSTKHGRLPRHYCLTEKGVNLLEYARPDLEIQRPPRPRKVFNDYQHRVSTVDVHIAFRQHAAIENHTVRWCRTYLDYSTPKTGRPHPITRVPMSGNRFIDPDLVCMCDCADGYERLFVVEVANGPEVARNERKIEACCDALADDSFEHGYEAKNAARVLFLFEQEGLLARVQRRMQDKRSVQEFGDLFFCKTLAELNAEHLRLGWRRLQDPLARDPLFGA